MSSAGQHPDDSNDVARSNASKEENTSYQALLLIMIQNGCWVSGCAFTVGKWLV